MNVRLERRAVRDLGRLDRPVQRRVTDALKLLEDGAPNLDVKALAGRAPWLRLRVGEHRVLYLPETADTFSVERIVHRRDLDRAVASLAEVAEPTPRPVPRRVRSRSPHRRSPGAGRER